MSLASTTTRHVVQCPLPHRTAYPPARRKIRQVAVDCGTRNRNHAVAVHHRATLAQGTQHRRANTGSNATSKLNRSRNPNPRAPACRASFFLRCCVAVRDRTPQHFCPSFCVRWCLASQCEICALCGLGSSLSVVSTFERWCTVIELFLAFVDTVIGLVVVL